MNEGMPAQDYTYPESDGQNQHQQYANDSNPPPPVPPAAPPSVPYPSVATAPKSSFEVEPEELHDVEFNEGPTNLERIRRGISQQYATVAGARDEEGFQHARKSSLLAEGTGVGRDNMQTVKPPLNSTSRRGGPGFLSNVDLETIQQLDVDYERALLTREIGWNARYISVRQNAGLSLWFFVVFLMTGIVVFDINTDWTFTDALLFSMYTITTVGYGKHEIPNKPALLLFICFYIFSGIAMLTILAAQLYQWVVLEVTWAQYERDSKKYIKKHQEIQKNTEDLENTMQGGMMTIMTGREVDTKKPFTDRFFDAGIATVNWVQAYVKDNPSGQLVVVLVPFSLMISIGAAVVGSIEGWTFSESIYFGVVSMTTVGFGDYYPSKVASMWFCIFWLPFSVGFLSLYLGSVAVLYIDISSRNVKRIENKLRRKVIRVRQAEEVDRAAVIARGTSSGFDLEVESGTDQDSLPPASPDVVSHLNQRPRRRVRSPKPMDFLTEGSALELGANESLEEDFPLRERRDNILFNSKTEEELDLDDTMKSMRNVISAVKQQNMATPRRSERELVSEPSVSSMQTDPNLSLKSTRHYNTAHGVEKKPSFALRVLVQERFSHIIAHEIAGYQSHVEIKNNTLAVTIDSLKHTADKWQVPRRARKSFRAVAFEVLYFVGERSLIVRGADAIFDLRPQEVQGLFAPLLAAFGDADTMEAWLMRTQVMSANELNNAVIAEARKLKFEQVENNRSEKITQNMTATPNTKRNVIGNAVKNQ